MRKTITKKTFKRYISKVLVVLFVFTLLCHGMALQHPALAATITLLDGQGINLGTSVGVDTIIVDAGATVNILDSDNSISKDVTITCGAGVTVNLVYVNIDVSGTANACALSFTGSGNTLILHSENTLKSGAIAPGIQVSSDTELEITGDGSLTVTGGPYGAGIGGGNYGASGTITISGGTVFAAGGIEGGKDIGPGPGASAGTFNLSGNATVFLRNDACLAPVTSTHAHWSLQTAANGQLYGYDLPGGWSAAGIYARACQLTYDDNGGTGGESVLIPRNGTATVKGGDSLSNPGYDFTGWSMQADGNETDYEPGDSIEDISSDMTLYAIWRADSGAMISGVTPGGSGAPPSGDIVVTFIDAMDTSAAGTVALNGIALAGGSWSNFGTTYTVPYSGLSYHQTYTVTVSGFKDSYGEIMPDTSHTFTTAAPARLQSLSVGTGSLNEPFDADLVVYTVDAPGIDSIDITAVTEDPGASLTINGTAAVSGIETTVSLDNGKNLIPVAVTSQDGAAQKSYIISVNGTASDADLRSLSLSAGTLNFVPATTAYSVTVGSDVTSVVLTASASDGKAVMLLDGAILTQGGTESIPLAVGDNTVELMVIAQDATTKTYTVTINRGSSDAALSALSLSDGTLSPAFNSTTYSYSATVAHSAASLTVTPTAADNAATVTVNGAAATTPVDLSVGVNTVTVVVTGADGVSTKTYTIAVTRQAAVTVMNTSLPVGIVGAPYGVTMTTVGGAEPFTWSAQGLPPSLSLDSATGELSGTPTDADAGAHTVTITATDTNMGAGSETYTLVIQKGCGNGAYLIVSDGGPAYTGSYTDDGIPTLTVNPGVSGFTYFRVNITAVTGHGGNEACVFVHTRGGRQLGFSFNEADYDTAGSAGAAFNVRAGDVIEVYIVDALANGAAGKPNVL